MKLHNMKSNKGSRPKKHRKGIGIAAGKGRTAGKGQKGQNSRTGGGTRPGFEGGQNPWYRRLPKIGFKNVNHIEYQVVNLKDLQEQYKDGDTVTKENLKEKGLATRNNKPVKLLGLGKLSIKLTIEVDKVSKTALAAVEKAGGKVVEKK